MTVSERRRQADIGVAVEAEKYLWSKPQSPHTRRMPGAVVFLIAVSIIAAVGMLYLLQTNHVANLGYEMSQLQAEREAALVEQQELASRIASRQSLRAVDNTARTELGLRPIDDFVFVDVELRAQSNTTPEQIAASTADSALERFWNRLTGNSSGSQETVSDD